jgi:predicted amidohydrolase/GNAT superfamily N-acetyltransferase
VSLKPYIFYLTINNMENEIVVRNLISSDYLELKDSMIKSYTQLQNTFWEKEHIDTLLNIFPEGQFAVVLNGRVVGVALSIIVDYNKIGDNHTYKQIIGNFTFSTHTYKGTMLYGIEVFIHPEFRGMRLGRRLYDARKELCERLNLRGITFGGRIPNYNQYADKLTPKDYIKKVRLKEIYDPVLTFQLSNEFHLKKVIENYLPFDEPSQGCAALLEWNNIYYLPESHVQHVPKTEARLGLVQWQMRPIGNMEQLCEQVEFFVDTVSEYNCDFILFPELFNAPLMADFNHLTESEAIRRLADYTEPLRAKFCEYAVKYNVNIITGSMPQLRNSHLYNVGYLCRRDGSHEVYEKIHVTPNELDSWGMLGGNKIKTFDTDSGRIGIVVCYDVEFPELSRLLAEDGMQILFVPFLTSTQNGYSRVRCCAQARAIENECYVAIAGCIGNLPKVHNMDIQFAQSAVFTPADFAFPINGIKAEATPNAETMLVVDVDLDKLKQLHHYGTVRIMKDRRLDLYNLSRVEPTQIPE